MQVATELTRDGRETILNQEIKSLTRGGYQLQYSTGTAASLVLPKPPSTFGANLLMTILTFGLWLIVWALMIAVMPVRRERSLYLEVLPDGTIERTTDGIFGRTAQDHTHRVSAAYEAGEYEPQYPDGTPIQKDEYASAEFVQATIRNKLYLLEDRLEVWKRGKLQRSLSRSEATIHERGRWDSFIIHDGNGEVWLDDGSQMYKSEREKVRRYLV